MDKRVLWAAAALAMLSLAGCTDGGDDDHHTGPTAEECAAQGLVLGEREVMSDDSMGMDSNQGMDSNESMDGMDGNNSMDDMQHATEPACVPAGPPATVTIEGLPPSIAAYGTAAFTWVLHTEGGEMHTMDTQVRISSASIGETELGMPDTYGDLLVKKEHQNFVDGQSYEAEFQPIVSGTYYLRAFALVNNENLWSPEYRIDVTAPEPTGVTHTVSVSGGGLPGVGSLDPVNLTIALGDAVAWENGDPVPLASYTITSTSGPESFATAAGGDAVVFLVPGSYGYDATGDGGQAVSGTVTVTPPA